MIIALKDNNELKQFITSIYNEFRNKNENFPYENVVEWFARDIACIAPEKIKEEMKDVDEKFESLMEDYDGTPEQEDEFDRLDNLAIDSICKFDDNAFPIVVAITAFGNCLESRLSFEFETAEGSKFGDGTRTMEYLKEYI